MAFETAVWFVDSDKLIEQNSIVLDSERKLETWLVGDLSLLGEDLLLIDQQTRTKSGPLDILAMDREGNLVIIELKKARTPREVVAQVLDYASWVRELSVLDIDRLIQNRIHKSLNESFRDKFGYAIPESACQSHRMIIVAAELDDSSERIIRYLQEEHEIAINAVFFSAYAISGQQMLVRAWLSDPIETQERAEKKDRIPWSGVWYVNNTDNRNWEMRRKYGFVSAGGAPKYYKPLEKLKIDDIIAVYQKKTGYLGVGKVYTESVPANDFHLPDGKPLSSVVSDISGSKDDHGERVVGVKWIKTFSIAEAKNRNGVFANQNIVCKLRDTFTLDFLRTEFGLQSDELGLTE